MNETRRRPPEPSTWQEIARAGRFLWRALRLRCPECGRSPMFVPLLRVRSLRDWYTPLDGCPRCGYAYEREQGYFLMAIWGVHYFTVAGAGLAGGLLVDHFFPGIPLHTLLIGTAVPTLLFALWFARYAKSIYVAIDHFFDPHVKPPAGPPGDGDAP